MPRSHIRHANSVTNAARHLRVAKLVALEVNESDVRARYNLGWCYAREKNFRAALDVIAEAMSLDKTGEYRERLMHKLQEIMQQLGQRHQQEYLLRINLVSRYAKKDEGDKAKPEWLDGSETPR